MCGLSAELRSRERWWDERLDETMVDAWMRTHVGCPRTVDSPSGLLPVTLNDQQVRPITVIPLYPLIGFHIP